MVIVRISEGSLRGKVSANRKGGKYFSFLGIPYAKPPIGNLRFKDPQPVDAWHGIKDATKEGSPCFGVHMNCETDDIKQLLTVKGSEDCLYLNVHTHRLPNDGNLSRSTPKPVMVWIHGGAFTMGSSSSELYGSKFLMCEDIVFVSINYRLGVLGFLSLEDPSLGVSGNAALKDMVEALRWVQRNIIYFNGDPKNVTIFGESAGGAAVHYLVLSPITRGLFHKAIIQSGAATCAWANGVRDYAPKLAKTLGCEKTYDGDILEFLQELRVEELFAGLKHIPDMFSVGATRPFAPVVEKPSPSAFITESPDLLLKSGQYNEIPVMTGYTSKEGQIVSIFEKMGAITITAKSGHILPHNWNLNKDSVKYKELEEKILKFYFGNQEPVVGSEPFINLVTDSWFVRDIHEMVRIHSKVSKMPIYLYRFSKEDVFNGFTRCINSDEINISGSIHGGELAYLFDNFLTPEIKSNSKEDIAIDEMVALFTNFAKYGNPVHKVDGVLQGVEWLPATFNKMNYLDIGDRLKSGVEPEKERMEFWQDIYQMAVDF